MIPMLRRNIAPSVMNHIQIRKCQCSWTKYNNIIYRGRLQSWQNIFIFRDFRYDLKHLWMKTLWQIAIMLVDFVMYKKTSILLLLEVLSKMKWRAYKRKFNMLVGMQSWGCPLPGNDNFTDNTGNIFVEKSACECRYTTLKNLALYAASLKIGNHVCCYIG